MKRIILLTLAACGLALTPTIRAEQSGTGHYMSGATADFLDMFPGEDGWAYLNIFLNYGDANAGGSKGLPFGGAIALNVHAYAYADSSVIFYQAPFRILGGSPVFGIAIPYIWTQVKASGTLTNAGGTVSGSRKDWASGFGDLEMWPFMLGWTNGDFKYDVRLGIYAPTGNYDKTKLANVGLGYWTFEPEVTFSWLSSKIGTEVSLFTGMDFNTKNQSADYQTGDIFHIDATVAQHLPLFGGFAGVGANGFWYKQITGDSGSGARLGGFEAEYYGVGPVFSYVHEVAGKKLAVDVKWLPQLHSEKTTKGNLIWAKVAVLF